MNTFKSLNIAPAPKGFTGEKIKIERILNKPIAVLDFKIEKSKIEGKDRCLHLQLEVDGIKRVLFTGGTALIEIMEQVERAQLPFSTTIIKDNDRLEFT